MFRLWALYAKMDLLWITRDVKSFFAWGFSDSLMNVSSIFGLLLLAERFAGIGVWSKAQVAFMLGYAVINRGLLEVFFSYNIAFISRRIGRGQLDHVLIQPQPIWVTFVTEGFSPIFGSTTLLPGIPLLLWGAMHSSIHISIAWLFFFFLNQIASLIISLSFQFIWGSLAFWAPRAAEEINSSTMVMLRTLQSYPLEGMGRALTFSLLTILPIGFMGWYPCRALLGIEKSPSAVWITPLASTVALTLMLFVFGKGMQHYGRAGSQRYTSQGHRS